jgi:hypothetical protein
MLYSVRVQLAVIVEGWGCVYPVLDTARRALDLAREYTYFGLVEELVGTYQYNSISYMR